MTTCPDISKLRQLLDSDLAGADSELLAGHLEECARCRHELDALAGVASLGAVANSARGPARAESATLLLAMENLTRAGHADLAHGSPTPLTRLHLEPTTRAGFLGKLGGIDIRRVIGRGGMGIVYEGVDPVLNRTVAVKVLSPHLLGDASAKERFLREAQAVAAFTHSNVVAIHAIAETDGIPYLVLQYVAGESLADLLAREGKLPADEMARIGAQIARGLAAAHAVGLVHRDVKPANVLVEAGTGRVLITDFGLAKAIGGASITGADTLPGTPAYMSPEQVSGLAVDARSDLFSLGILLYQGVSGSLPFTADSPFVVLDKIRHEKAKALAELDPALPVWFCSIVERLLEKDPSQRVPTASAVAAALEQRSILRVARARWLRWAVAAALVLGLVAAGYYAQDALRTPGPNGSDPQRPAADAARTPFAIVGRAGGFASLADAIQATQDGDIIEVQENGPHRSPKIEITGKRLAIRAGEGLQPVFMPEDAETSPLQWISSDSDVSLTGLDVDWPVHGKASDLEITLDRAVVVARGQLTLTRCRIVSGNRTAGAICDGTVLVDECHLISDRRGGRCLVWRADADLKMSRTALEGKIGLVLVPGLPRERATVEINDCTIRSELALMALSVTQFKTPVSLTLQRCLVDADQVTTLSFIPANPGFKKFGSTEAKTTLRKVFAWSENENVYRRKPAFLTSMAPQRPKIVADLNIVADWLAFWKIPDAKSIEGDIRFHPRPDTAKSATFPRLDRIDQATGPVPTSVGIPLNAASKE